jgi:hypothetical protein
LLDRSSWARPSGAGDFAESFPAVPLQGRQAVDKVIVTWTDNDGDTQADEAVIV